VRERSGSADVPSRVGGASGPEGRLETVQEVLTGILVDGGPGPAGLTLVVTGFVPSS
jgi:hypothetical protein